MKNKAQLWKPVALDSEFFLGDVEGLIGIEECTDYELPEVLEGPTVPKKGKKKRKKKDVSAAENKKAKLDVTPSKSGSTLIDSDDFDAEECANAVVDVEDALESVSAWNSYGLHKNLLLALARAGFLEPTQIQALALPPAIHGRRDILGAAETGSGKTLAFGLPILNRILKIKEEDLNSEENQTIKPLYALILTPTRELAFQVRDHLVTAAKFTDIKIAALVGGMASVKQERLLNYGPEIVVATPGRLWELIQLGNSHLSQINNIKFLAIDETDRMLERGHFKELHLILERMNINESKCKERQNFVFSATLTLTHGLPKHLARKKRLLSSKRIAEMTSEQKLQKIIETLGITDPKVVDITQDKKGTSTTLTECRITCEFDEKDYYLYYFLRKHPGRTLIFCNSIGCVKRVTTILNLLAYHALPLHASMQQRQRLKNLDKFKEKANSILVATDVAARGLDIPSIEHVLHYQTPRTSESYVHRSGRTARASKDGITVLLTEPTEISNYIKLCRTLGKTEDIPAFPIQNDVLETVKATVNLARDLDKLELQYKKVQSESGWIQKAAEEMDIIVEDDMIKHDSKEAQKIKKVADIKRKQLADMLVKPLFPRGFSGKYPLQVEANTLAINTDVKTIHEERAIDVMKTALEGKVGRKAKPLFKKRQGVQKPAENGVVKTIQKKQKQRNKKRGKK